MRLGSREVVVVVERLDDNGAYMVCGRVWLAVAREFCASVVACNLRFELRICLITYGEASFSDTKASE